MGLFTGDFRFLLSAKCMGLDGGDACTISRQPLFFSAETMVKIAREFGQDLSSLPRGQAVYMTDDVLRALGFDHVDVLDISSYEGANILQDLNEPVLPQLHEKYALVVDGGTLEHVFNFPLAIENIMRMVKVGGDVLLISPANNYCGHGFYQISPELFFRIFSAENGFELLRMFMQCNDRYYHVVDPAAIHGRVELTNPSMALLMVHARKIGPVPKPLKPPQQSDYVDMWADRSSQEQRKEREDGWLKAFVRKYSSPQMVTRISSDLFLLRLRREAWQVRRRARLSNRKLFVPVTRWDVMSREVFASLP